MAETETKIGREDKDTAEWEERGRKINMKIKRKTKTKTNNKEKEKEDKEHPVII